MGSLLSSWGIPTQEAGTVFRIIQAISAITPKPDDSVKAGPIHSTRVMNGPFKSYHDGDKQAVLALSLGRRRPNFIPAEISEERRPLFKLTHLPTLLCLLRKTDHKIQLLRRLASRVTGLDHENSIILCFTLADSKRDVVFASAGAKILEDQHSRATKKRGARHRRWIERPTKAYEKAKAIRIFEENLIAAIHTDPTHDPATWEQLFQQQSALPESNEKLNAIGVDSSNSSHHEHVQGDLSPDKFYNEYPESVQRKHRHETVEYLESDNPFQGNTAPWFHDTLTETVTFESSNGSYGYLVGQRDDCESTTYYPICEHASLYCRGYGNSEDSPRDISVLELTYEDVLWCFESGLVSSRRLWSALRLEQAFGFLRVLSAIYSNYEHLAASGATICSAIVDLPFQPPILDFSDKPIDWPNAADNLKVTRYSIIGLIGYFETAHNVVNGLQDDSMVIGLSGGDSIFVSSKVCISR